MSVGFCPRCGTGRTGELRFCRSCGYDFQPFDQAPEPPKIPTAAPPVPWTYTQPQPASEPAQKSGGSGIERVLVLGILAAVVVTAFVLVGNQLPTVGGPAGAKATITPRPDPTYAGGIFTFPPNVVTLPPELPAATVPPAGPLTKKPGEVTTIYINDVPSLTIVIDRVAERTSYTGQFSPDRPKSGYVYLEAFATYTALADGADYGSYDWQVFAGGTAVETYTSVLNGPEPELSTGTLPKGRKASGWLIYEVPKSGRVLLSYGGGYGRPPVFEVVVRA